MFSRTFYQRNLFTLRYRYVSPACAYIHESCLTHCDPQGLQPIRLLCPGDSPGKNTGVDCHFLLWEIFPTQGLNSYLLCLLHWICHLWSMLNHPVHRRVNVSCRKGGKSLTKQPHFTFSSFIDSSDYSVLAFISTPTISVLVRSLQTFQEHKHNSNSFKEKREFLDCVAGKKTGQLTVIKGKDLGNILKFCAARKHFINKPILPPPTSLPPPCTDKQEGGCMSTMKQEVSSHQKPNRLGTLILDFRSPEL